MGVMFPRLLAAFVAFAAVVAAMLYWHEIGRFGKYYPCKNLDNEDMVACVIEVEKR
jgi:hypothetical protein